MPDSPYELVKVAGRLHLVTYTQEGSEAVALSAVQTSVPDPGPDHARIAAAHHARACRSAAAMEVAGRHAEEVEAYLVGLPDGMYSDRIDPRFNDEEDLARQRAEMVRHLGESLTADDPYQATRLFDRSLGLGLTIGMVRLCEAYVPQVAALVADDGIRLRAAKTMEADLARSALPARLLERWRQDVAAPSELPSAPSP